jgi:hypothetical protein
VTHDEMFTVTGWTSPPLHSEGGGVKANEFLTRTGVAEERVRVAGRNR